MDRILKGEKRGELPIQQPAKFDLVINLKTAMRRLLSHVHLRTLIDGPDGEPVRKLLDRSKDRKALVRKMGGGSNGHLS